MTALEYPLDGNEQPEAAKALYEKGGRDKVLVFDEPYGPGPRKPRAFAEGLAMPMGLLPYKDGALVGQGPDVLWITDITEHPTREGKLYCAAVMDAYSRLIIGWSIADHMRTELVTDALGMAILRRQPEKHSPARSTVLHSDHGSQFTSWAFGQRLRAAGMLASMGTVGDCYDNAMMESFWGTMQLELLDSKTWDTREELASAVFEWIECWYNPKRRHSSIGMHSPIIFETLQTWSDEDH
jgi:putative transposase